VGWQEEASSTGDHGAGKEIQMGTTPTGWIKFNVDSFFVQQSGKAGVGVVARDSKGDVLLMHGESFSTVRMLQKQKLRLV
jgi:hypothetical protein